MTVEHGPTVQQLGQGATTEALSSKTIILNTQQLRQEKWLQRPLVQRLATDLSRSRALFLSHQLTQRVTAETSCAKTGNWLMPQQILFYSHLLRQGVTAETHFVKTSKWLMQKILFFTHLLRQGGTAETSCAKTCNWLIKQEIPFYHHVLRQGMTAETSSANTGNWLMQQQISLFILISWGKEWLQRPLAQRLATDLCSSRSAFLFSSAEARSDCRDLLRKDW